MDKRKTRLMSIFDDSDNSTEADPYQDDDGEYGSDKDFDPQGNTSDNRTAMDNDEEKATLDGQFSEFAKLMATDRNGTSIDLYHSDYWLRQSKVLDDRVLTMTDTGLIWLQFGKTELTYGSWYKYLTELCFVKDLNQAEVVDNLTCCGLPGVIPVIVPQYRSFFDTYKSPNKLVNEV